MNVVILFREGLSGYYLKALIDDTPDHLGFRVDPWYPEIVHHPTMLKYGELRTPGPSQCWCVHRNGADQSDLESQYDVVLSILVHRKIYHATYNNFHKKILVEQLDLRERITKWQQEPGFWYDIAFYNLKEYHYLFQQDNVNNHIGNVIDFDRILDFDYIQYIFETYLHRPATANTKRLVTEYRSMQLAYDLSGHERSMEDIVMAIPDHEFSASPWFAAYCIFKYETNNQLVESQRQWSIDNIGILDKKKLQEISRRYRCP